MYYSELTVGGTRVKKAGVTTGFIHACNSNINFNFGTITPFKSKHTQTSKTTMALREHSKLSRRPPEALGVTWDGAV